MRISQSEWDEWVQDQVTVAFREWLTGLQEQFLSDWAATDLKQPMEQVGVQTAIARAKLDAVQSVLDAELDLINGRND